MTVRHRFLVVAGTGTASLQHATSEREVRLVSSVRRERHGCSKKFRFLRGYTMCEISDVTRTCRNGNTVLVESRSPRDCPLPSGTMRNRVGVTTSRVSQLPFTSLFSNRDGEIGVANANGNEQMNERIQRRSRTETTKNTPKSEDSTIAFDDTARERLCGIPRIDSRAAVCRPSQ